ncbi:hypothetical protein M8C21_027635, partial [Ambrosia artemisiifolia]
VGTPLPPTTTIATSLPNRRPVAGARAHFPNPDDVIEVFVDGYPVKIPKGMTVLHACSVAEEEEDGDATRIILLWQLRNVGMCMHDEATPHYVGLIDQTTMGHMFINKEFGQKPRVGWQIDPLGHSAVQAYLLGAEVGFDSLFFARMDYQDREKRKNEKALEIVWQGSKSLGSSSQIFTGIFPRHYDPPGGFTFEINDVSPPIQEDHLLFYCNVQERVDDFVAAAIAQIIIVQVTFIKNEPSRAKMWVSRKVLP